MALAEPDEMDERYKKWSFATLPILPESIPLKVLSATKSQFSKIKKLINDTETDSLICATDAGREGELIFRYIYEKAGCKKPFERLWISSMTDEAIREGFREIRPGKDYDGLYESARCRSRADWLVGMNASRAFTLKYDTLLSVGRVQTPTLAILVKRRKEIESFRPEGYCTLTADFGDYRGVYFSEKLEPDTHLKAKADAETIAAAVKGKTGTVTQAETTRKKELPPQLYDLTSLQRDANRMLGFTADKTLKTAQSLYETHKALTYPRTDSRYLPPDMIPRVVQTMKLLPQNYQKFIAGAMPDGKLPVTRRTIDASKVTDHHAILPTAKKADISKFSEDEKNLYDLVARRMLAAFHPACEYDATKVVTALQAWGIDPLTVSSKTGTGEVAGKGVVGRNGMEVETDLRTGGVEYVRTADTGLVGEEQLLAGGTPATRAAIIERLIKVGYAARRGKTLNATDKGVMLIDVMPQEIASPETTGRWELALHEITDGKQDPDRFMDGIRKMSAFLVEYAREKAKPLAFPPDERRKKFGAKSGTKTTVLEGTICPVCGKGKIRESSMAFSCSEAGCKCTLWKDCLQRSGGPGLTAKLVTLLLEKKELTGSTGIVAIRNGQITFTPNGQEAPAVSRTLIYEKRQNR